jgi:urea carboxylase-associated protein 1
MSAQQQANVAQDRDGAPVPPPCLTSPVLVRSDVVLAGDAYMQVVQKGQTVCIVDLYGNQAVDTLFFAAADPRERYSATDTIRAQGGLYLSTGTVLISSEDRPMLTIVHDTCGRHDTLGGACAAESNMVRYDLGKKFMHNCRDSFLLAIAQWEGVPIDKRHITANINFFMNVPVTPEGGLTFEDGISDAGKQVAMRAEMDVIMLVSNCPQLNNPCNAYNPTPVRIDVWREDAAHG